MAEIFPKGVVNVIAGRGASVGQTLVEHPKVAMVSLTGDVSTGRKILQAATGTLKRTHLELGGKAPVGDRSFKRAFSSRWGRDGEARALGRGFEWGLCG